MECAKCNFPRRGRLVKVEVSSIGAIAHALRETGCDLKPSLHLTLSYLVPNLKSQPSLQKACSQCFRNEQGKSNDMYLRSLILPQHALIEGCTIQPLPQLLEVQYRPHNTTNQWTWSGSSNRTMASIEHFTTIQPPNLIKSTCARPSLLLY